MDNAEGVKYTAKLIVQSFVHHVKEQVGKKDENSFVALGINDNFEEYRNFFCNMIAKFLSVTPENPINYPKDVTKSVMSVLQKTVTRNNLARYLQRREDRACIYTLCFYVLDRIRHEEFEGGVLA